MPDEKIPAHHQDAVPFADDALQASAEKEASTTGGADATKAPNPNSQIDPSSKSPPLQTAAQIAAGRDPWDLLPLEAKAERLRQVVKHLDRAVALLRTEVAPLHNHQHGPDGKPLVPHRPDLSGGGYPDEPSSAPPGRRPWF